MGSYYNENDPFAAEWLRQLIAAGEIPDGYVDERSIVDVRAEDLRDFTQCHFFAGIGGWALALKLAGWPATRPVWTGSPPCQPFSVAGKQLGVEDSRHLAPHFLELVAAVRPPVLFGEQVAAAVNKDMWLDDLLDALEGAGYATGAAVAPACSVGAPHLRQRLWFVGRLAEPQKLGSQNRKELYGTYNRESSYDGCESGGLADTGHDEPPRRKNTADAGPTDGPRIVVAQSEPAPCSAAGRLDDTTGARHDRTQQNAESHSRDEARLRLSGAGCEVGGLGLPDSPRSQQGHETTSPARHRYTSESAGGTAGPADAAHGGWEAVDWLFCRDGKWRPTPAGLSPLADGLPRGMVPSCDISRAYAEETQEERVGRLRGYGNAINPQLAAEIIREVM